MNQEQKEQYLLTWHNNLQKKETELLVKQNDLKLFEENLLSIEDQLHEKLQNNHCTCCKFNNLFLNNPDSLYAEWGVFKRTNTNSETRLGVTSIGEIYLSQTFQDLFDKWLTTDIGKEYKDHKLIATYVTKADLSWNANDWRLIDNPISKLFICEKSGRNKIKFIIE
ncbi:unnamed protein product [Rhizophagus irregularis]|uniref:Uncharacterized protein n=1 Tax=Rhizophagus irregularis TaxID=588596 RepID=A0A2N1NX62_9GLOM|nr:hypothetical protein RhiirC2_770127 [Rhizophagus irregularis]CAB4374280.1 unnamed protein product [Rhizophagus irregularis]CAB5316775.1 unnamed protein product [Rhizophagus irregularis]